MNPLYIQQYQYQQQGIPLIAAQWISKNVLTSHHLNNLDSILHTGGLSSLTVKDIKAITKELLRIDPSSDRKTGHFGGGGHDSLIINSPHVSSSANKLQRVIALRRAFYTDLSCTMENKKLLDYLSRLTSSSTVATTINNTTNNNNVVACRRGVPPPQPNTTTTNNNNNNNNNGNNNNNKSRKRPANQMSTSPGGVQQNSPPFYNPMNMQQKYPFLNPMIYGIPTAAPNAYHRGWNSWGNSSRYNNNSSSNHTTTTSQYQYKHPMRSLDPPLVNNNKKKKKNWNDNNKNNSWGNNQYSRSTGATVAAATTSTIPPTTTTMPMTNNRPNWNNSIASTSSWGNTNTNYRALLPSSAAASKNAVTASSTNNNGDSSENEDHHQQQQKQGEEQQPLTPFETRLLIELQQMGFTDRTVCIKAIRTSGKHTSDDIMLWMITQKEEEEEAKKMDLARLQSEQLRQENKEKKEKAYKETLDKASTRSALKDIFNNNSNDNKASSSSWILDIFDDALLEYFLLEHKDILLKILQYEKKARQWYRILPKYYFQNFCHRCREQFQKQQQEQQNIPKDNDDSAVAGKKKESNENENDYDANKSEKISHEQQQQQQQQQQREKPNYNNHDNKFIIWLNKECNILQNGMFSLDEQEGGVPKIFTKAQNENELFLDVGDGTSGKDAIQIDD